MRKPASWPGVAPRVRVRDRGRVSAKPKPKPDLMRRDAQLAGVSPDEAELGGEGAGEGTLTPTLTSPEPEF